MQETREAHPALILSTWMPLPVMAASAAAFLRICPPPSNILPGTEAFLRWRSVPGELDLPKEHGS